MGGIVRVGLCHGPGEVGRPAQPIDGAPQTASWNDFSDPTGRFHCGLWTSDVGAWPVAYSEAEFCVILSGRVRLEGDDGEVYDFAAGDSFVIPSGYSGIWRTVEPVRKLYALFEPAPAPVTAL